MRNTNHIFLVFFSLLLCSCGKDIFSNGPVVEEDRTVQGNYQVIELLDNVDVTLIHRKEEMTPGHIHLRTCENLIEKIGTEIHGDTLTISNNNKFNWLRPYDYPLYMTVYYDTVKEIIFNSNGNLSTDTLYGYTRPDIDSLSHLFVNISGGSGDVKVLTHCRRLHTDYVLGTSAVTLKGDARIAFTSASYDSHGPIDALELNTNIHYVYSHSTNHIKVKAYHEIGGYNDNNGSVYYLKYTEPRWNYETQDYYDVHCPETVSIYGKNIFPLDPDQ